MKPESIDEICTHSARPERPIGRTDSPTASRPPIHTASVYACPSTEIARKLNSGENRTDFAYRRDRHPNGVSLAEKCRRLHGADHAVITASGMSALSLALVALLKQGDHVLLSERLYGKTQSLFGDHAERFGIGCGWFPPELPEELDRRATSQTRLVVVETISNPMLKVADIPALAAKCHERGALLLVDNTFATPWVCRPLEWGADLVMESVTKLMNGHSDVVLGLLCGRLPEWKPVEVSCSTWGLGGSPFDCWLAERGLSSLHLRCQRACENALKLAQFLDQSDAVTKVSYPGLPGTDDFARAQRLFGSPENGGEIRFGNMVTFEIPGGSQQVDRFLQASGIEYCPSLGELSTTISHPCSSSHVGSTPAHLADLGINEGTIRVSTGIESWEYIRETFLEGLNRLDETGP